MAADGSITAVVKINITDAEKSVERLKQQIIKLNEKINANKGEKNALTKSLEETKFALEELRKKTSVVGDKFITSPENIEKMQKLKDEISQIEKEIEKCDAKSKKWNSELEGTKEAYGEAEKIANELRETQGKVETEGYDDLTESARETTETLEELDNELRQKPEDAQKASASFSDMYGVTDLLSGVLNSVKNALVSFTKLCGTALKKAAKTFFSLGKNVLYAARNMNVMAKLSDKLGSVFQRLGSMMRRVFVFSVLTSFFRSLRKQITEYLGLNSELMTSLGRLKSALSTAFNPILTTVIPILTSLINVLTQVISVVAQFIAAIFGTTAKKAQANAKALNEQAKATEAAGNAAEEASQQIAGFDEINSIATENKGGGGAGSGAGAGAGEALFDLELDDTSFKTWGEAFDAFLDHILNEGIPSFKEGLLNFSDYVNSFSSNLEEMFTFPGVKEKMQKIGEDIAEGINEAREKISFEQLGNAIGYGLDDIIALFNGFLNKLDSLGVGKSIANFINGLVDSVSDWKELGRTLWGGFEIGLKTLAGILQNLKMPELANAASNIVIGFFDAMRNTIENDIDWELIGRQIAIFLQNIRWSEILDSVYGAIKASIEALRQLIVGFLSEFGDSTNHLVSIVNTIFDTIEKLMDMTKEWVQNLNFAPIGSALYNLSSAVSNLASAISDSLLWAYENVLLPLASWAIEEAAPAIVNLLAAAVDLLAAALEKIKPVMEWIWRNVLEPIGSFAWSIISTALEGITNTLKKLTDLLKGNMSFKEFIDTLSPGEAIVTGLVIALTSAATIFGTVSAAASVLSPIIAGVSAAIGLLTSPIGLVVAAIAGLSVAFVELYKHSEGFRGFIDGIVAGAKELVPGIIDGIKSGWNSFTSWLDGLWKAIVDGFKKFFGIHSPSTVMAELGKALIEGLLNGIKDIWKSITSFFEEKTNEIKKSLTDTWENIKSTAAEKWNNINESIKSVWKSISDNTKTTLDSLKENIANKWDNLKQSTSEKWENIKSTISNAWNNIKSTSDTSSNAIKEKIISAWTVLRSDSISKWNEIKSVLVNSWNELKSNAVMKFQEIKQSIIDKVSELRNFDWSSIGRSIVDGIVNGLQSIWNTLSSWAKNVKDTITNAISGAKNAVSNALGGSSSRNYSAISAAPVIPYMGDINIPKLAMGAVIPPNREFMAVLGDQRNGNNLEAPEALIRKIVREESGNNNDQLLSVLQTLNSLLEKGFSINVDGATFGRTAIRTINNVNAGAGRQLLNI